MRSMISAALFGAAIGAAATMFYMNHEEEINSISRELRSRSGDTLGTICDLGRDISYAFRKQA